MESHSQCLYHQLIGQLNIASNCDSQRASPAYCPMPEISRVTRSFLTRRAIDVSKFSVISRFICLYSLIVSEHGNAIAIYDFYIFIPRNVQVKPYHTKVSKPLCSI